MSASRGSTSGILKGLKSPAALAVQPVNEDDAFEFIEAPRAELPADEDDGFAFVEAPAPELEDKPAVPPQSYLVIDNYEPPKPSVVGYEVAHRPMSPEPSLTRKYAGLAVSERTLSRATPSFYSQTAKSSPNLSEQPIPAWMAARQKPTVNNTKTRPSEHRDVNDLGKYRKMSNLKSFHQISTIVDSENQRTHILKHINATPPNSAASLVELTPAQIMSELEPMAVAFFRLIATNAYFPYACTVKEADVHLGVCSEIIKDFESLKVAPLNDADLKNESYVAGLAVSLTTSYIFEEMDLHRNNLSKTGIRIDGDELLWPILSQYKFSEKTDPVLAYKKLNINFPVHEDDIKHLPNFSFNNPYYWPTQSNSFLFGTIVPDNAYTPEDIQRFKRLETHPVFVYHKYKTLLKFILTTPDMYGYLAVPHVSLAPIRDNAVHHISKRLQVFRDTLIDMPEFREFMRVNGLQAFTQILGEFARTNAELSEKSSKLTIQLNELSSSENNNPNDIKEIKKLIDDSKNCIVDLAAINSHYDDILDKIDKKSIKSFSMRH